MNKIDCHFCKRCQRTWEHDNCSYPVYALWCPNCVDLSGHFKSASSHWDYIDDFELWVMEVRARAGV